MRGTRGEGRQVVGAPPWVQDGGRPKRVPTDLGERGIALIATLLVVLVVGALVMGALILSSNQVLADRSLVRKSNLVGLADAGLEITLSYLNADGSLFPDSGFVTVEDGVPVYDGNGREIPAVRRWSYAGPSGTASGLDRIFGNVVSVVRDRGGGVAIRRQQFIQESFAKYAYFHPSQATFHDEVTVGRDVSQPLDARFERGVRAQAPVIPMPDADRELRMLRGQAEVGHAVFAGNSAGGEGAATLRIEFLAVDLNGDGDESDEDEGFFRVYQSEDFNWVSGKPRPRRDCRQDPGGGERCDTVADLLNSENCGDYHSGRFVSAGAHNEQDWGHTALAALKSSTGRCFLGGSAEIWGGFVAEDGIGRWSRWGGPVDSRLRALRPLDADYLFPISRQLNPDFRGVIYIDGKVVLSGRIRGRVTVAATGNIIFGDDLTYVTDPGAGTCRDMAGYFSAEKVVMSNNAINSGIRPTSGEPFRTYDESASEFLHGVVLAMDRFIAEDFTSGSGTAESCGATRSGRGCLFLTGGVIQNTRGAVGLADGHGYKERYSYDQCAAAMPPPYFPTTGVFVKGQYYQVEPAGFEIGEYFHLIATGAPVRVEF